MWKTIGGSLLRCGAVYCVFGVFGIVYYVCKWSPRLLRNHSDPSEEPDVL